MLYDRMKGGFHINNVHCSPCELTRRRQNGSQVSEVSVRRALCGVSDSVSPAHLTVIVLQPEPCQAECTKAQCCQPLNY